eukprot:1841816-Prymnesium_polylepis.1
MPADGSTLVMSATNRAECLGADCDRADTTSYVSLRHRVGEFWAPTTDLIYRRSAGLARKVRTWSGKSGPRPDFSRGPYP